MLRNLLAQRKITQTQVIPTLSNFDVACKQIEFDANFRASISDKELLGLIADENNEYKSTEAVIIVKSNLTGPNNQGRVYEIRTAQWEHINSNFAIRSTDMRPVVKAFSTVVLVNAQGEYSFYQYAFAAQGNFNNPLNDLHISHYLYNTVNSAQEFTKTSYR